MTRHFADADIRQYLLGDLPDEDREALEAAYLGDPELLARMELVEHDLADEYAAGRLSSDDRVKVERRLLSTAEGREDAAVASALRRAAEEPPRDASDTGAYRVPVWLGWAAAALIVAGAALAWQLRPGADRTGTEAPAVATTPPASEPSPPVSTEPATPASPPASESPTLRLATLMLTSDLARSGGQPPTFLVASDITHVDLLIPAFEVTETPARGRVESVEGKAIWTGPIERPTPGAADGRARARIPVGSLPPGDYIFSISIGASADTPAYYFRVRAR